MLVHFSGGVDCPDLVLYVLLFIGQLNRLRNVKRTTLNVTKRVYFFSNVGEYICSSEMHVLNYQKHVALSIISHLTETVILIPALLMEWKSKNNN